MNQSGCDRSMLIRVLISLSLVVTPIWSLSLEGEIDEKRALARRRARAGGDAAGSGAEPALVHRLGGLLVDAHAQWLADMRRELSRNQRHHPVWTMVASAGAVIVGRCAG